MEYFGCNLGKKSSENVVKLIILLDSLPNVYFIFSSAEKQAQCNRVCLHMEVQMSLPISSQQN